MAAKGTRSSSSTTALATPSAGRSKRPRNARGAAPKRRRSGRRRAASARVRARRRTERTSSGRLRRVELRFEALPRLALVEVQVVLVDQCRDAAAHAIAQLAAKHAEETWGRDEDESLVCVLQSPVLERCRQPAREFLDLHLLGRKLGRA